jgi:hypothetical protein
MLVYIQWSLATPQDWQAYDLQSLNDWRQLPKKDAPTPGGEGLMLHDFGDDRGQQWVLDPSHPTANDEGWITSFCFAGIRNQADHHYAGRDGARIRYVRWNDAADWQAMGDRYAQEFSFGMPVVDDEAGILQPDIMETVWAEAQGRRLQKMGKYIGRPPARYPVTVYDWSQFSEPGPANMVRHSVWMTDALMDAHMAARTFTPDFPGWASLTGP